MKTPKVELINFTSGENSGKSSCILGVPFLYDLLAVSSKFNVILVYEYNDSLFLFDTFSETAYLSVLSIVINTYFNQSARELAGMRSGVLNFKSVFG